jgi:hypothetical protein
MTLHSGPAQSSPQQVHSPVQAFHLQVFEVLEMRVSPASMRLPAACHLQLRVWFRSSLGSHEWLGAVAVTMILVQALDAYIGFEQRDVPKTAGPIFLSLLNLGSLILLLAS